MPQLRNEVRVQKAAVSEQPAMDGRFLYFSVQEPITPTRFVFHLDAFKNVAHGDFSVTF